MESITYVQAILIGLLQGVTELFPISSLGHSVILPSILHWNLDQRAPYFLSFLVLVHVATAFVLIGFFWKDCLWIIKGFFTSIVKRKTELPGERLAWLIIIATIPAGILGLLLEKKLRLLFASPYAAAAFLIANGLVLYIAETTSRKTNTIESGEQDTEIARLSSWKAFKVGCMQCLALIPGFSRTGSTMAGAIRQGLSREAALRFSFLLSIPIILAAAVLKLPELYAEKEIWGQALAGAIAAGVAAFFAVKFLEKYFKTKSLYPFALYCFVAGTISLILLSFGI